MSDEKKQKNQEKQKQTKKQTKKQTEDNTAQTEIQIPLGELLKTRRDKVLQLAEKDINCYPYKYERTHLASEMLKDFDKLAENETAIKAAGRIMLKRKMGKSFFADLHTSFGFGTKNMDHWWDENVDVNGFQASYIRHKY